MVIKRERRKVSHQKKERERTADDIPKHCATARLRKISRRTRERERRTADDIPKHCVTARPRKSPEGGEREREQLIIFISIAAPQDP